MRFHFDSQLCQLTTMHNFLSKGVLSGATQLSTVCHEDVEAPD